MADSEFARSTRFRRRTQSQLQPSPVALSVPSFTVNISGNVTHGTSRRDEFTLLASKLRRCQRTLNRLAMTEAVGLNSPPNFCPKMSSRWRPLNSCTNDLLARKASSDFIPMAISFLKTERLFGFGASLGTKTTFWCKRGNRKKFATRNICGQRKPCQFWASISSAGTGSGAVFGTKRGANCTNKDGKKSLTRYWLC
jgi:hypothetical protein